MFEYYCFERDRFQSRNDTRTEKCLVCNDGTHSKVNCPLMHFCPLESIVVQKYLKASARDRSRLVKQNRRGDYIRSKNFQSF